MLLLILHIQPPTVIINHGPHRLMLATDAKNGINFGTSCRGSESDRRYYDEIDHSEICRIAMGM